MDGISNKPGILDQKIYRILPDRITEELVTISLNDGYNIDITYVSTGFYRMTLNIDYEGLLPDFTG